MVPLETRPLQKLEPDRKDSLYGQIYDRIREWIRIGKIKEGDALPSERELADIFAVSRVPVREALKALEFMGVVRRVRGKGVVLKRIEVGDLIDTIDFVMMNPKHTHTDLFEVREGIEIQAARLAAQRRTNEDLAAMEKALGSMQEHEEKGQSILEHSMEFHSALIAASHNPALMEINRFLEDWLRYLRSECSREPGSNERGLREHRALFASIKTGDVAETERKMREHLEHAKKSLRWEYQPSN